MTEPLPCPFCGVSLRRMDIAHTITYQHPQVSLCFVYERGFTGLRDYNVPVWNTRATVPGAPVCYEVIDGVPVFNEFGQGTRADPAFINKCFGFLLTFWKNNQK